MINSRNSQIVLDSLCRSFKLADLGMKAPISGGMISGQYVLIWMNLRDLPGVPTYKYAILSVNYRPQHSHASGTVDVRTVVSGPLEVCLFSIGFIAGIAYPYCR